MAKERDYEREIKLHEVQSKIEKVQLQIEQKVAELASLKKAVSGLEVTAGSDPEMDRLVAERKHLDAILRAKDRYKKACEALLQKVSEHGSVAFVGDHEDETNDHQQVIVGAYEDGD